jgi:hypothetical protein
LPLLMVSLSRTDRARVDRRLKTANVTVMKKTAPSSRSPLFLPSSESDSVSDSSDRQTRKDKKTSGQTGRSNTKSPTSKNPSKKCRSDFESVSVVYHTHPKLNDGPGTALKLNPVCCCAYQLMTDASLHSTSPGPGQSSAVLSAESGGHVGGGGSTADIASLNAQMGMVIQTLTAISSEMKTFKRAVSNMDVLIRSVQDLQESSSFARSETLTVTSGAGNPLSSPPVPMSPGNHHRLLLRGRNGSQSGTNSAQSPRNSTATAVDDLRVDRIVRAGNEGRSAFRVSGI